MVIARKIIRMPYKSVAVKGVGIEKVLTVGSVIRGVCVCVCMYLGETVNLLT